MNKIATIGGVPRCFSSFSFSRLVRVKQYPDPKLSDAFLANISSNCIKGLFPNYPHENTLILILKYISYLVINAMNWFVITWPMHVLRLHPSGSSPRPSRFLRKSNVTTLSPLIYSPTWNGITQTSMVRKYPLRSCQKWDETWVRKCEFSYKKNMVKSMVRSRFRNIYEQENVALVR